MTTDHAPAPALDPRGDPAAAATTRPRIFSGIQPSGIVHLGNDLGAIRNYVALQTQYEAIYCIVDYHALTSTHDADVLRARTREMAAGLLALGLDPDVCTLFVQSHRPEHTELAWLFCTVTPVSWVERPPSYKEKQAQQPDDINHGLLTYPVLQAADIAIYKATLVPVGRDQAAHLELSREIVRAFNRRYGETFPEPQAVFTEAPNVLGTDGVRKMSKSFGNYIALEDAPSDMFGKLMSISDTLMLRYYELLTTEDLAGVRAAHPMEAKQALAALLVARYHGIEAATQARADFQRKFSEREFPSEPDILLTLSVRDMIRIDLREDSDIRLPDLVEKTKLVPSKSEARRLVIQGGIEVDDKKESDPNKVITFKVNQRRRLKIGRRKFAIVEFKPDIES